MLRCVSDGKEVVSVTQIQSPLTHYSYYVHVQIMAKKTGFYPHPFAVDDKIAKLMEDWGKGTSTKLQARMTHLNRVRIESDQAITRDMLWAGLALALVFVVSSLVLWRNSRVHCKSHLAIVSMLASKRPQF